MLNSVDLVAHAQDLLLLICAYVSKKIDIPEVLVTRGIAATISHSC